MRLAERPAQRLRPIKDEDQVNVVGHEAVGPDRDAMLAALLRKVVINAPVVAVRRPVTCSNSVPTAACQPGFATKPVSL